MDTAYANIFPTMFRYIVLGILYTLVFANFTKASIQFILFMVIMILNFFTVVFVARDMIASVDLMKTVYGTYTDRDAPEIKNPYAKYFVGLIGATSLLFVCSISIVLAVFDYGKKNTNDYMSYTLTPSNKLLMEQFEVSYQTYMVYLAIFVYFIIFAHTSGQTKIMMFNLACIALSIIVVSTAIYCCYISVRFLDNKKYRKQLYQ